jgi:uncharacterized protein (DUF1810 family)
VAELDRFKTAQSSPHTGFDVALQEIRRGGKTRHWIWWIFPQLQGLGSSGTSEAFGIEDDREAAAFLRDSELRLRLEAMTRAVGEQLGRGRVSLRSLMGSDIDAKKLVSSLTLFGHVARRLRDSGDGEGLNGFIDAIDDVMRHAGRQGYPPCVYTMRQLRKTG